MPRDGRLSESMRRELAVKADCDPRTIARVYEARLDPSKRQLMNMARERARRVLVEAGLLEVDNA